MSDAAAVELRDVDFAYGRVQVLFDIGLRVEPGETVALLGANGAGKSTLLRVISGLSLPQRGEVLHHGEPVTRLRAEQRLRRGIVQLTGGAATFPDLTVTENLRAGAYCYPRREVGSRISRALEPFPVLAERGDAKASDLSGGQQHMLAFAMALLHDPDVLLVDELSLGLAPIVVQQIVEVIRELRERRLTMIIVEHTVDVALELADRAVFMEKGSIRFAGPSSELGEQPDLLRAAFLGG
ncbi:MAG TPA: ABC transporter ATP-binding protein [Acidimicrobiales bacterium]|nr:ABC transporter ATP-binding protein [Acidimicrobiales bacterium]